MADGLTIVARHADNVASLNSGSWHCSWKNIVRVIIGLQGC